MGLWDVCHHEWGRMYILPDHLLSLSLSSIGLTENTVSAWPSDLGIHVGSLSMAFKHLTNVGLRDLL